MIMITRQVAATIEASVRRPSDLLARYGGEEFAVVLPGSDLAGAVQVGDQILRALANRNFVHDASSFGYVTVSIGAAAMVPQHESTVEQLTAQADAALYAAKREGRNRIHTPASEPIGFDTV